GGAGRPKRCRTHDGPHPRASAASYPNPCKRSDRPKAWHELAPSRSLSLFRFPSPLPHSVPVAPCNRMAGGGTGGSAPCTAKARRAGAPMKRLRKTKRKREGERKREGSGQGNGMGNGNGNGGRG